MPIYRKNHRAVVSWIVTALGAVGLLYGTMFALISSGLFKKMGPWGAVAGMVPFVGALVFGWIVMKRIDRRRLGEATAWLRGQGFEVVERPTPQQRQEFGRDISHLFRSIGLERGEEGLQWFAVQDGVNGLRIFEHEYTTGSGKFTQVHQRTALFWPARHPDLPPVPLATAAWFSAARLPPLIRRQVCAHELALPELTDFARDWSLLGNAESARRFLCPAVIAQLEDAPKEEEWGVGAGWVCCSFRGPLDAGNLAKFLAHAREVLKAVS